MLDLHIHTNFSPDSFEEPETYINQAIKKNVRILGFSEHIDFDYVFLNFDNVLTDIEEYCKNANRLKKLYSDKIKILCGGEFGFCNLKKAQDKYKELNSTYPFDYVINSVHIVDKQESYFLPYFKDKTKQFAYDRYFETVLESLNVSYDFQIIGHLGYVSRNAPFKDAKILLDEHRTLIDEILKKIISAEKTIEINTNVRTAGSYTLPSMEIINRYFELGGRLVTLASDSHRIEQLFYKFDDVLADIKKVGFKNLVYYENKKLKFMDI